MKRYLIPERGRFYKANLHCHTTVSDGSLTPEEVKEIYVNQGYSIVAFTDHHVFVPHPELADTNFLPLNGYELSINDEKEENFSLRRVCHICMIALKPDNLNQACYHRTKYCDRFTEPYRSQVHFDDTLPDYEREYSPECIGEMMQIGRDNGFFVTYNHPTWSLETPDSYLRYHGMHAMEIYNHGSGVLGYPEYNEKEYDQILRGGERIFCIAADDNHNHHPSDSRRWDSFGGFTMIKAEKLEYETVTHALLAGHFYASQGPQIHSLWVEDGRIHITCSPTDKIVMNTGIRRADVQYAENGQELTCADFEIKPEYGYVRLTITDQDGKRASTNAYFTDDLLADL